MGLNPLQSPEGRWFKCFLRVGVSSGWVHAKRQAWEGLGPFPPRALLKMVAAEHWVGAEPGMYPHIACPVCISPDTYTC